MLTEILQKYNIIVPRETIALIEEYVVELKKWNKTYNLVSRQENDQEFLLRHIADSAQILEYITDKNAKIADIGTGGGLPGIVMAITLDNDVVLYERRKKKCAFLAIIKNKFRLHNVEIRAIDVVVEVGKYYNLITSRAMCAIIELLDLTANIRNDKTRYLLHKGKSYRSELAHALSKYQFEYTVHTSKIDNESCILEISKVAKGEI